MSHSNIKAPASPKCGRCVYATQHPKTRPCTCCKDNSQYKADINRMTHAEIMNERYRKR